MDEGDDLLPESYFKLKHPAEVEKRAQEMIVEVGIEHFQQSLSQVIPSISLQELLKYEQLRDKYSSSQTEQN